MCESAAAVRCGAHSRPFDRALATVDAAGAQIVAKQPAKLLVAIRRIVIAVCIAITIIGGGGGGGLLGGGGEGVAGGRGLFHGFERLSNV